VPERSRKGQIADVLRPGHELPDLSGRFWRQFSQEAFGSALKNRFSVNLPVPASVDKSFGAVIAALCGMSPG
jgi:hypothetical protein